MSLEEGKNDKLLHLVKLASEGDPSSEWPSPEMIASYIQGSASEEERSQVRRALDRSASFRREYLSLIRDLEEMGSAETKGSEVLPARVPESIRREVLREYGSERVAEPSLWERLRESIVVRVYVPVAAAAAILFVIIQSLIPPSSQEWKLVRSEVEPAELISMETRSVSGRTFTTAEQAALAGFAEMLEFEGGQFQVKPADSTAFVVPAPSREITLTLTDSADQAIATFVAEVPRSVDPKRDKLTAWLLTLPERGVYRLKVGAGSSRLRGPQAIAAKIIVVAVFQDTEGFHSTPFQPKLALDSTSGGGTRGTGG